jgi:hypothetical protein
VTGKVKLAGPTGCTRRGSRRQSTRGREKHTWVAVEHTASTGRKGGKRARNSTRQATKRARDATRQATKAARSATQQATKRVQGATRRATKGARGATRQATKRTQGSTRQRGAEEAEQVGGANTQGFDERVGGRRSGAPKRWVGVFSRACAT